MMFSEFLIACATFLGTTTTYAGIFLGLLITFGLTLAMLIATTGEDGNPAMVATMSFLILTVVFTAMGWYPIWTGSILGLAIALLGAFMISKAGKP